ncbi:MAG: hypothetical protein ACYS47_09005, partial [Planctomycetota bacterium]
EIYENGKDPGHPYPDSLEREKHRRLLLDPGVEGPVRELLMEVDEYLGDAAGASLARHGIRRRRKPEGIDMILSAASQLAASMGDPPFEVLLSENAVEEGVALEYLKTPALVVGPEFRHVHRSERAFLLGRSLAMVREKLVTGLCEPAELRRILTALASIHIAEADEEGGNGRAERAFRKKVRGALPRRVRKSIEPLIRAWWFRRDQEDLEAFHRAVLATADRWGLVCTGDPCGAIRAKLRFDGGLDAPEKMETAEILRWIQKAPDCRDLIAFAVSEGCAAILARSRGA